MGMPEDLVTLWHGLGVVATVDDVFIGDLAHLPDDDGPFLSIGETRGSGPEYRQEVPGVSMEQPGLQVTARGVDYEAARALARAAYAALPVFNQTIGSAWYRSMKALQPPYPMGLDSTQRRVRFAFNVVGDKKPA